MPWVKRQADEHVCKKPKPSHGDDTRTGDIWECPDCESQYEVTVRSDPRDVWFEWKLVTAKFLPHPGGKIKP